MLKGAIWQVQIKCWWCSGGGGGGGGSIGQEPPIYLKLIHQTIDENSNLNNFVIKMFSRSHQYDHLSNSVVVQSCSCMHQSLH